MRAQGRSRVVPVRRLAALLVIVLAGTAPASLAAPGDRSRDGLWLEVDPDVLRGVVAPLPRAFHVYRLDFDALTRVLGLAPPEGRGGGVAMTLPTPDGL